MNILRPNKKSGPVVLVSRQLSYSLPLSYAYLAGYLLEKGEDVKILYRRGDNNILVNEIMKLNPILVGFGNLYPELQEIGKIIGLLNKAGRTFPVVIGGQMVSPIPEFSVKVTGADYGVLEEGEITLHKLVVALREDKDPSDIGGLVIRNGCNTVNTGPGEVIKDLSNLPKIPYELFPEEEWLHVGKFYTESRPQPHWRFDDRVITLHGGRGCPFRCNFCYHHSSPRYRSISDMISEVDVMLKRYNANMISFSDDLVIAYPKRAKQLADGIKSLKRPVEYSITARLDVLKKIDNELLAEMKASGCRIINVGVESGSDRILDIIGKRVTASEMLETIKRITNVGIFCSSAMMVGQHTETREDVEKSIEFMKNVMDFNPNFQFSFSITTPFPGSELYDIISRDKLLKDDQEFYDIYFSSGGEWKQVVNLSAMSDEEVIEMYKKINTEYTRLKVKTMGKRAIAIEKSKKFLGRKNRKIQLIFLKCKSLPLIGTIKKTYDLIYWNLQRKLENLYLKLRGFEV